MPHHRFPRWFDFDIDREIERMSRDFERAFRQAEEWSKQQPGPGVPMVWGYSMTLGPEGPPRFERFGNAPLLPNPRVPALEGAWEPYVSCQVDEEKRLASVTADLPGVDKKDIRVRIEGDGVVIEAAGKERKYAKTLRIGAPLVPDSARARYNNGVLDLTVELAKAASPRGHEVRVE